MTTLIGLALVFIVAFVIACVGVLTGWITGFYVVRRMTAHEREPFHDRFTSQHGVTVHRHPAYATHGSDVVHLN